MKTVKEKRSISDRDLNYIGITNLDGVYVGCLNWITDEAVNLEQDIKSLKGFCKDDVSAILLEEFERQIASVREGIDKGVTGTIGKNPADNIVQDYPKYIAEMFGRIQLLVPHLSTLSRMRSQLDAVCGNIMKSLEEKEPR